MQESQLAPGLLLAMPQLADPHFSRAVVLMIEHGDEGSFGLIINQPSEILAVDLLKSLEMPWAGDDQMPVWAGGPVSPHTGWVLHQPIDGLATTPGKRGALEVAPGLVLSTSADRLRTIAQAPPPRLRLLLGYAGWGPGQLAAEMARGSWLHADLDIDLVFATDADAMWDAAVRSLGIEPDSVIRGAGVN